MVKKRILIVGAGLGGLTAALALRQAGHEVLVYEQAPAWKELGAGISLSQAAQSVYRSLGLEDALRALASVTADMAFVHYKTGVLLAGNYDHGDGRAASAAPLAALQLHRAELHALLAEKFERIAPGCLNLGHQLLDLRSTAAGGIRLSFANVRAVEGDMLIGADGLKSCVRGALWGPDAARFTGQIAYRFLVEREVALPFMGLGRAAVFQGPGRVFNRYSIRRGALVNCVGIVRSDRWVEDGWSIAASREEVMDDYAGWHPDVTGLMGQAGELIKWGIFDRPSLPCWSVGAATLLGDAAHPMLPFLGLGAAMAIEDAMVLARAIEAEASIGAAFARYEAARRGRTAMVQQKSREQGEIVQRSDPDHFGRAAPPSQDPSLYSYDPVTAPI